mgnify:CR=1 FL=1
MTSSQKISDDALLNKVVKMQTELRQTQKKVSELVQLMLELQHSLDVVCTDRLDLVKETSSTAVIESP